MDKIKIMEIILKNREISQKKIAQQASMSIGKVNYIISELVDEDYLIIDKTGKSFRYTVTEKAGEFLLKKIDKLHQIKINFHETVSKKVKQAVILAGGKKSDFEIPVCLIEIYDKVTLLNRMNHCLKKNGIEKVVIVCGYHKKAFYEKVLPINVKIIENNKYRWTGSLDSLIVVQIEIDENNKNSHMTYEYMIIDIGYLKMNDLIWAEIDNVKQFDNVMRKINPLIKLKEPRKPRTNNEDVREQIQKALDVSSDDIKNIIPFSGMTNINYKASIGAEEFVVRMPGAGTDEFINRSEEKENLELGTSLGINPVHVYFNADTGLKITKMIPNAETLTPRMTKKEEIMKMVTSIFKMLHHSEVKMNNRFELFELMEKYEWIARNANGVFFEGFDEVKKEVYMIKTYYETLTIEDAPTHIDALYHNFIKSGYDKLYLIDWEYSGMFDPLWDIATFSIESEFTVLEEELFLSHYFQKEITEMEKRRILIHKIFQDYLWMLWTIFKEAKGDNFGSYGNKRFDRVKKNIAYYKNLYSRGTTI